MPESKNQIGTEAWWSEIIEASGLTRRVNSELTSVNQHAVRGFIAFRKAHPEVDMGELRIQITINGRALETRTDFSKP